MIKWIIDAGIIDFLCSRVCVLEGYFGLAYLLHILCKCPGWNQRVLMASYVV